MTKPRRYRCWVGWWKDKEHPAKPYIGWSLQTWKFPPAFSAVLPLWPWSLHALRAEIQCNVWIYCSMPMNNEPWKRRRIKTNELKNETYIQFWRFHVVRNTAGSKQAWSGWRIRRYYFRISCTFPARRRISPAHTFRMAGIWIWSTQVLGVILLRNIK